jgi:hypothetical protein
MKELRELAALARTGDSKAAAKLRRRLEEPLRLMVRRTIQLRTANSTLARRILAEADQLAPAGWSWPREKHEWLVQRVAGRICQALIDGAWWPANEVDLLKETVRN